MAGGKQTPRQKMIGMMYLVLTALLALNVTKEVVNAFVTINDKLDASSSIIGNKINEDYTEFDLKKMTLLAKGANLDLFNTWKGKADSLQIQTAQMVDFLLGECNAMIKAAEGEDWIAENGRNEDGGIIKLKPLMDIGVKDNYDIPTQIFIGGDPTKPIDRGVAIREMIHDYRNDVTEMMGTYSEGEKEWRFTAPEDENLLDEALKTVNPKDKERINHFYRSLTIPETLYDQGEAKEMPWVSVTFNRAPIVAATAMFTALKVDVKNAESIASEFMLSKIKEPPYPINKIEPMTLARSGYLNIGDSMQLNVLIAAYDSTEVYRVKWGMNEDTLPERWKETTGGINLDGASPGKHRIKGAIGVRERGGLVWKPWEYDYEVGQPTGAIAQPEMRVLYRGYENILEGSASGFPADMVSLRGNGCTVRRNGGKWIATVENGVRNATINVVGEREDGTSVTVGTYGFKVKPIPDPIIYLGSIKSGDTPTKNSVVAQNRIRMNLDPSVNLTDVKFKIKEGKVEVSELNKKGKILSGGFLDENAKNILRQSSGKTVTISVKYADPSKVIERASLSFQVR